MGTGGGLDRVGLALPVSLLTFIGIEADCR
jgi:hypothetical protein